MRGLDRSGGITSGCDEIPKMMNKGCGWKGSVSLFYNSHFSGSDTTNWAVFKTRAVDA